MFLIDLLFALLIGLLLTSVFARGMGRYNNWDSLAAFFLVIVLAGWAASVWVATGPVLFDVYWLPTLITGLLVALLFLAFVPEGRYQPRELNRVELAREEVAWRSALALFGTMFWLLTLALLAVVVIGYLV